MSLLALSALGLMPWPARAGLTNFQTWTQVQDPADLHYRLPEGVNGKIPGASSLGYAFSPDADFALAIGFAMSFGSGSVGSLGIGFGLGIGEGSDGINSAEAALLFYNGTPVAFGVAARVDDINQLPLLFTVPASATGSMFISYQAASGNVTLGAADTLSASSPMGTGTFTSIQNQWDNGDLLVSLFLRSDGTLGTLWQSGTTQAVFSNMRMDSPAHPWRCPPRPRSRSSRLASRRWPYGGGRHALRASGFTSVPRAGAHAPAVEGRARALDRRSGRKATGDEA